MFNKLKFTGLIAVFTLISACAGAPKPAPGPTVTELALVREVASLAQSIKQLEAKLDQFEADNAKQDENARASRAKIAADLKALKNQFESLRNISLQEFELEYKEVAGGAGKYSPRN
jgi:hypothetical protein